MFIKFNKYFEKLLKFYENFKLKKRIIFLDPNNPNAYDIAEGEKLNVILSPSLYWVKKVKLPVKYVRDVKKLLPSLFEDILPAGNYSYSVYKDGNEFFIFAYEDKLILDTLSTCGVLPSSVVGMHFAQSELQGIVGAATVNEMQSIYVKDEIVVLVPCCWIEETGDLDLAEVTLSKHKISLQHYAHIVDNSSLYKIGVVLVVLMVILLMEVLMTKNKVSETLEQKDKVFASYKLKPTMMQNKSMLKKYKKIYKKQTDIRDTISYILKFKLQNTEKLQELNVQNSKLNAKFSDVTDATLSRMRTMMKSENIKHKLHLADKTLHLEVEL